MLDQHHGHAVWNCHVKPTYDDRGNVNGYEPWIVGQGITLIPASMDEVWFLERHGSDVTLYTERDDFPRLGSRYHLPPVIKNASFPVVKQLIEKNMNMVKTGKPLEQPIEQKGGNDGVAGKVDFSAFMMK